MTEEDELANEPGNPIENDELEPLGGPMPSDLEAPEKGEPVVEPRGGDRLPVEPRETS